MLLKTPHKTSLAAFAIALTAGLLYAGTASQAALIEDFEDANADSRATIVSFADPGFGSTGVNVARVTAFGNGPSAAGSHNLRFTANADNSGNFGTAVMEFSFVDPWDFTNASPATIDTLISDANENEFNNITIDILDSSGNVLASTSALPDDRRDWQTFTFPAISSNDVAGLRTTVQRFGSASNNDRLRVHLDNFIAEGAVIIPEPGALGLLACGGLLMLSRRRRSIV